MALYPAMSSRMFTPCHVLKCEYLNIKGQRQKEFIENDETIFIAFSDFQGTEQNIDGAFFIQETATICAPYIPGLSSGDRIKLLDNEKEYEIINAPENWNMQNVFLVFKVQRVEGGA